MQTCTFLFCHFKTVFGTFSLTRGTVVPPDSGCRREGRRRVRWSPWVTGRGKGRVGKEGKEGGREGRDRGLRKVFSYIIKDVDNRGQGGQFSNNSAIPMN
jgi:hypothetical protein